MHIKELRNKSIYQIFVRNHSISGKFKDVENDLERIKSMGFDYLYLLPIYPIGELNRKGKDGSPYSIKNYRKINPEFGDENDFLNLVNHAHDIGLKIIIDIVMNHTSCDHVFTTKHKEYYFHDDKGNITNRVPEWADIIDLDYSNKELFDEQIDMLLQWADKGVDGFRADVASTVPLSFWKEARQVINSKYPDFIWIAESVEGSMINDFRNEKWPIANDYEMYQAFDVLYDYDVFAMTKKVFSREYPLSLFKDIYNFQSATYSEDALKLRFLENHDQPRIAEYISDKSELKNWLAYSFFAKGLAFVYEGQEYGISHRPSIFDKDTVDLSNHFIDFTEFISRLNNIRKREFFSNYDSYKLLNNPEDILVIKYGFKNHNIIGIFNVRNFDGYINIGAREGIYHNLLDGNEIVVKNGLVKSDKEPIIIEVTR